MNVGRNEPGGLDVDVGVEDSSPCRLWDPWDSWLAEEAVVSTGRGPSVAPVGAPEGLLLAHPEWKGIVVCAKLQPGPFSAVV